MPFALVPMVPNASPGPLGSTTGTHPLSLDFGGNAVVLSPTVALGWTPAEIIDVRVQTICDDKLDTLAPTRRVFLQNILPDRRLQAIDRFGDIIGGALKKPPAGAAWKALTPNSERAQFEILLGPGEFLGTGVSNPGLLWRLPAAVSGPHSQNLVDTFDRVNGNFIGSTSSDGLFTWSETQGTPAANMQIATNQCRTLRTGGDLFPICLGSVPMDTADAYVQMDTTLTGTATYVGPLLRNTDGTGGAGDTGYYAILDAGSVNNYTVYNIPNNVILSKAERGGVTGGTLYLLVSGSTWLLRNNGVTILSGSNSTSDGSVGHRKVGFLTAVAVDDTSIVDINNFSAADFLPRRWILGTH